MRGDGISKLIFRKEMEKKSATIKMVPKDRNVVSRSDSAPGCLNTGGEQR